MTQLTPPDGSFRSAVPVSLVKKTDRQLGRANYARLSNSYLKDCARQVVVLKFLQYVTVGCLCMMVVFLMNFSSVNYRVFATSKSGALYSMPPIDEDVDDSILILWIVDALVRSTTMGFHDYDLRLTNNRDLFTDRGWESYNRFLRYPFIDGGYTYTAQGRTSIYSNLEKKRLLMWGEPVSPPQIVQRSLVGGVRTYRVRVEMDISKRWGPDFRFPDRFEVVIERVGPEVNSTGLAISQWRWLI